MYLRTRPGRKRKKRRNHGQNESWRQAYVEGFTPTKDWHFEDATPAQLRVLREIEIGFSSWICKGEASHLIDTAKRRLPGGAR